MESTYRLGIKTFLDQNEDLINSVFQNELVEKETIEHGDLGFYKNSGREEIDRRIFLNPSKFDINKNGWWDKILSYEIRCNLPTRGDPSGRCFYKNVNDPDVKGKYLIVGNISKEISEGLGI